MAPRVRTLVGLLFLAVLILPLSLVGLLRVYESVLIRQTEQILIAEAVVVGEAYRRRLDPEAAEPLPEVPPGQEPFHPFVPQLDIESSPLLEPATRAPGPGASSTAAEDMFALLERALVRNLTGVRVLDQAGVVVASPSRQWGYSLAHLPEVKAALSGAYAPTLRRRYSDEPKPPLASRKRRAGLRVSVAIPVFRNPRRPVRQDGEGPVPPSEVLGVIYNSRTPLDVQKSLWLWRRQLYLPAALSVFITLCIVAFLTLSISRPLQRLQRYAELVTAGEAVERARAGRIAPQEIRELMDSIADMKGQLESRTSYIREFAANAAHELKTPLTSLQGASELLLEDWRDMSEEQRSRFIGNIHDDAVRMNDLVQRILDLARIEAGPAIREPLNLWPFVEGVVQAYRTRGRPVELEIQPGAHEILANPEQMEALVKNLLDNAFAHGHAPVKVSLLKRGSSSAIIVENAGERLTDDHFDRAFERFFTTDRGGGGTGLGLAIVRAIATNHQGRVEAQPRPEGGARVEVVFRHARDA